MKKAFLAGFVSLALAGLLAAQQPATNPEPAAAPNPAENIKVRVDLVNVLLTVTNKRNHLENGLAKEDFRVFEDNKPQIDPVFQPRNRSSLAHRRAG